MRTSDHSPPQGEARSQPRFERLRPQDLVLTMLGHHVLDREVAVASQTFIDALERCGVSMQATRSTLTRMVRRGRLVRHRVGRKAYFTLAGQLREVLREGEARIFSAPVRDGRHDRWTLLSFSIPDDQRSDRHSLRAALRWHGFGLLRNGLWIAPGDVEISRTVERLGVKEQVTVFSAHVVDATDVPGLVAEVWDLDALAGRYQAFIDRWTGGPPIDDELAAHTYLITEWQRLLTDEPELPVQHLPADWPAMGAYQLFRRQEAALSRRARATFEELLDSVALTDLT